MIKLTDHETEVLSYLAMGLDQKETAKRMKTSYNSLNQAVASITRKHKGLQRAIDWFIATDWAGSAIDELPDEDEPQGPVQRCAKCGLAEPHRCVEARAWTRKPNPNLDIHAIANSEGHGHVCGPDCRAKHVSRGKW